jgi:hypothetical protein
MYAYGVSGGIGSLILILGTRWEWSASPPVPIEEEIGWAAESVRTMGSLLKISDFPDIVYVKICTYWTGFILRTLSAKSMVSL